MNPLEMLLLNAALNPPPPKPKRSFGSTLAWIVVIGLVLAGLFVAVHNAKPSKKPLGSPVKVQ